jgi:hypothetical protein
MEGNMQTEDDTLESKMAWVIVRKYRSRARQLVLVEPQSESKDRYRNDPRLWLVTHDEPKCDALAQ